MKKMMMSLFYFYTFLFLIASHISEAVEFQIGFTRWPAWEVVGIPGSAISIPCVTNVSAERISWQFNHHFLLSPPSHPPTHAHMSASVSAPYDVRDIEGGSELVVHLADTENLYRHQLGLYQCVAWFGAVALTSLPGHLRAARMEPYALEEEGRVNVEVEEGQGVRVECGIPDSTPEAQLTFYKDGEIIFTHNSTVYHTTPHGDLVMGNVNAWAAGEYTCSAYNSVLNITVRRNTRTSIVVVKPTQRTQPSPPHFITLPADYTALVGSNVTLLCLANGHPKPNLRWSKYGGTLPDSSTHMDDGSLRIVGLSVEDEGEYLCHAENGMGDALIVQVMQLEVLDPPRLIEGPASQEVEEGSTASLSCSAHGHPKPKIMWVFNGRLVRNDTSIQITENELRIVRVKKEHAGIFQCFVHNPQGTVQKLAVIRVVPKTVTVPPSSTNHQMGNDRNRKKGQEIDGNMGTRRPNEGRRQNQGRNRNRGKGRRKGEEEEEGEEREERKCKKNKKGDCKERKDYGRMFPPSQPRIAKVSDESVMVSWDDPRHNGLPVMFYKIQYKVVRTRRNRGSHWMTVDEDIPPHIRSFEVTGLRTGRTYKFRMAAVYSNNDNMLGHTSRRFILERSRRLQPPATPTISDLKDEGPSAVTLVWEYSASGTPVEGFFINYKEATKAGDYTKVTVLGENKREVLISHLQANISYDFKIQAFNLAGASEFSPVFKRNVLAAVISKEEEVEIKGSIEEENSIIPAVRNGDPVVSNMQLYIILGAVVGILLLIVVISAVVYSCRNSHINDDTRSVKYEDTSLHIHREASTYSLPDDGKGRRHNGYLPHQGITVTQQETDKVAIESSLIENNNHNIQDGRCYSSPARRIASEDACDIKSVPLVRTPLGTFDRGIREVPRT